MSSARNYRISGGDILNRSCAFDADLESILLGDPPQNPFSTASTKSGHDRMSTQCPLCANSRHWRYCMSRIRVSASSWLFQMAGLISKKSHCHAINAIALIGRGWPVGKNVSKMTSALSAVHFDLQIAVDWILFGPYRTVNRIGEARPAGVAFVFCLGNK